MDTAVVEHPAIDYSVLVVVDVQGKLARLMHASDAMIQAQRVLVEALPPARNTGDLGRATA